MAREMEGISKATQDASSGQLSRYVVGGLLSNYHTVGTTGIVRAATKIGDGPQRHQARPDPAAPQDWNEPNTQTLHNLTNRTPVTHIERSQILNNC
jgi:hypothetical protein